MLMPLREGISLQQLKELGTFIETVLATPDVEIKDRKGAPQTWEMVNLYVINSFFVVPLTWKDHCTVHVDTCSVIGTLN